MRTFLAIDLGDTLRSALASIRASVTAISPEWAGEKWVSIENLHLTLRFLGDQPSEALADIAAALMGALADVEQFESECLRVVEPSPHARKARMLWSRFDDPDGSFTALAHRIDAALCPLGIPPESRGFVPHVTLCRARSPRAARLDPDLSLLTTLPLMSVREVTVFTSELTRIGPIYTRRRVVPLAMR